MLLIWSLLSLTLIDVHHVKFQRVWLFFHWNFRTCVSFHLAKNDWSMSFGSENNDMLLSFFPKENDTHVAKIYCFNSFFSLLCINFLFVYCLLWKDLLKNFLKDLLIVYRRPLPT
ncbi:hypothetical protein ABFS83_12G061500 [Erythranthe nasuta]